MARYQQGFEPGHEGQNAYDGTYAGTPVRARRHHVGCLAYASFLFGFFWILGGSFWLFAIITDMPGRGTMPLKMQWMFGIIMLFVFGIPPFAFGVKSFLKTRRINKANQRKYQQELAQFDQFYQNMPNQK